ncbi:hypothetical protein Fot_57000 [Forsythia ovata]|uniref:Uncharacterized protein n=1 Tax=Forsythia ovata TaxID=205694 RepID=A0ABD1P097_9LAMI
MNEAASPSSFQPRPPANTDVQTMPDRLNTKDRLVKPKSNIFVGSFSFKCKSQTQLRAVQGKLLAAMNNQLELEFSLRFISRLQELQDISPRGREECLRDSTCELLCTDFQGVSPMQSWIALKSVQRHSKIAYMAKKKVEDV